MRARSGICSVLQGTYYSQGWWLTSSSLRDVLTALYPHLLQGTYIDKKCPFTGNVAIRGRILKGIVVSTKMQRTIVLRRDYLQFISKYRCALT